MFAIEDDDLKPSICSGYLDLFLIHDPLAGTQKRLDTWRGLIKLRDEGKLLSIGVSNYGVHHLEEIKAAGLEAPSINQIEVGLRGQYRGGTGWLTCS